MKTTVADQRTDSSERWKVIFGVAFVVYCVGIVIGFLSERLLPSSDVLVFAFLACLACGGITLLVSSIGLATTLEASSAVAAGAISLFMAFFLPMLAARLGVPIHIDDASVSVGLLTSVAGLGGIVLFVVGFIRIGASRR